MDNKKLSAKLLDTASTIENNQVLLQAWANQVRISAVRVSELEAENAALKAKLRTIQQAAQPIQKAYNNFDDDIKQFYEAVLFVVYHAHARDEPLGLRLNQIEALVKAIEDENGD